MRSIGYFASSGSSILVPNIVGQTTSAASTTLSSVGLVLGSSTGTTTSGATSENNGKIASQSVAAGTYTNYGTTITYTTYSYTAPCVPSWSCGGCNGCTQTCSDGCGNVSYPDCSSNVQIDYSETVSGANSTTCFYSTVTTYQNSCSGAITYVYGSTSRARACPSCPCETV